MGLDMYLHAKKDISDFKHTNDVKERAAYRAVMAAVGLKDYRCDDVPSLEVSITVAYWRKANAIHKWFVEKVQDGVDECQESHVTREQLQELVAACKQVLDSVETVEGDVVTGRVYHGDGSVEHLTKRGPVVAQKQVAANALPTQGGFFFGGTDYDEYYLEALRDTVEQLAVLQNPAFDGWEFSYRASW